MRVSPAAREALRRLSATFGVTATFAKGASFGSKQAWLTVSEGGSMVAHAAVYAFVK